jgi:hypothetical protein
MLAKDIDMVSLPFSETFDSFFSLASSPVFDRALMKHGRNVVFSERVKVVEIPSAKEMSKKERKALWYPEPESVDPKKSKIRKLLCVIDNFDDRDESRQDEDDYEESGERQRLPVTAVLVEQRSQRELGVSDTDFIAKIYRQCSSYSIYKANIRALQHEQEIRDYIESYSVPDRKRSVKLFRL